MPQNELMEGDLQQKNEVSQKDLMEGNLHRKIKMFQKGMTRTAKMSQKRLMKQDLGELDVAKLHPLSPEVVSCQPTTNIGTIGHVAHGKTTVVRAISGVQTNRFKCELERNITMKLGYANAKMKTALGLCATSMSCGSGEEDNPLFDEPGYENCRMKLLRHVSFVDCPGHEILMATMLNGATIMDGAFLLVAANESCPQPQTLEHLSAVDILNLQNIVILQNKVDLVSEHQAKNQYQAIQEMVKGTAAEGAPVIPIAARLKYNIDVRDFVSPPHMIVIRSFDVNKPGCGVDETKGGVVGGSITRGVMKVNQVVELRPGLLGKDDSGNRICQPIYTRVISLFAEQNELQFAVPGGLIGVGTTMDPALSRCDRLVGQILGEVGTLPDVSVFLMRQLLGVRTQETQMVKVSKLRKGETIQVNVLSMVSKAKVVALNNGRARMQLAQPVCTRSGEKVALSRCIEKHWRLIGWGEILGGNTLDVRPPVPSGLYSRENQAPFSQK
ncbi:hypothetical protein RJ639_044089 [Escallonia herrerae]|uniref:protein-synthesizing GTPase n=1 Tax=Escallonia herrerae TaxID=1293975 RepID=A0AA88WCT4_9ASTE|nr:hypothetical protein RJ639_044089 [Escallonia herrerae]